MNKSTNSRMGTICVMAFAILVCCTSAEAQIFRQRGNYQRANQSYNRSPQNYQASTKTSAYWANSFEFAKRDHDFGAVPTASNQEHVFEFKNSLSTPIRLTSVRASCGCTKPKILTPTVQPGEIAKVLAKFDTMAFRGKKSATVTLVVQRDQPYSQTAEVQFSVRGKIRQDVVMSPGLIKFENVAPGSEQFRTVQVKYAGDPNWQLRDITSSNPHISVEKKELVRNRQTGRVDYELKVKLAAGQPIGMFLDELKLVTNDVSNSQMKLAIEGRIKPVVESSAVNLGVIQQDSKIEKRIVVRGSEAFHITDIKIDDPRIKVDIPQGKKSLHILNYVVDTSSAGDIETDILVLTDAEGQPETKIPFRARISNGKTIVGK